MLPLWGSCREATEGVLRPRQCAKTLPMIRLFTAVAIPAEVGEHLLPRQHRIEGARWRPREAFHITLKFIGDVQDTQAADLDEELQAIAAPAFDLALAGVGHFGEGVEIHAVWAGVAESPDLRRLAKANE